MGLSIEDAAVVATAPFDRLVPTTAGYRTAPIERAFNWSYTLENIASGRWYLIVFRSVRRPGADFGALADHDDLAFAEAIASGGLLRYYKGALDLHGRCLSLCVWDRRTNARTASARPDHRAAARLAQRFYLSYDVERYVVRKRRGHPEPQITWASGTRRPDQPVEPCEIDAVPTPR